jgi:hypothetical protein
MAAEDLKSRILKQWNIPGLLSDLRKAKWGRTEPDRIDRRTWIGSYDTLRSMARAATSVKEWKEAAKDGFEDEIVDEYMEALAEVVMDAMGKELRREHVYTTFEDGDGFLGQYEDMSAKELKAMGFEIEE